MQTRSLVLSLAVASCLAGASAAAAETAANPAAEWTCSKCPFGTSYEATADIGGAYVDESSAKFGDYTGLDQEGGYLIADAEGRYASESGYTLNYELTDLGLDSRAIRFEGGRQGAYDFGLFYDRVPHTIWDTTQTPFRNVGSQQLNLPSNWVFGGSTSGMTSLDEDLRDVDVGFNRDRYGAVGRYFWGENMVFAVDYRRDERSGLRSQFGAIGGTSTQLLKPLDDATDRWSATVRYQTDRWFAEFGYFGSFYDTKAPWLRWQNPFASAIPGTEDGRMAMSPDNDYNEFMLSAGMHGLPGNTTLSFTAATGKGTQDANFLPYTINPDIATLALPMANLHGDVDVTRADFTITSRPLAKLRMRGSVTYDERENNSKQAAFDSQVYTDAFPMTGDTVNPVYGYERFRVLGSADYAIFDQLSAGLGGEYRELKRTGTEQEVSQENLLDGWGRVEYRPSGYLGIVLRGGALERDPDSYDIAVADELGQNPLMRKYNMAYLYRSYGEVVANVALGSLPLTLSANGYYADDSYTKSEIGLRSGINYRYGLDLNWAINDKVSAYVSGGQDAIQSRQLGSSSFSTSDWRGRIEDTFDSYGAGVSARFGEKTTLELDYTYAKGDSQTTILGVDAGDFPAVTSKLNSLRADLEYALNERLGLAFTWWWEKFDSKDWALVGVDTLPNVLSLGAEPYDYDVNYLALSLRYSFAPKAAEGDE
jgi:MtrB/PioB family decaheme-associated outer membrane protein